MNLRCVKVENVKDLLEQESFAKDVKEAIKKVKEFEPGEYVIVDIKAIVKVEEEVSKKITVNPFSTRKGKKAKGDVK